MAGLCEGGNEPPGSLKSSIGAFGTKYRPYERKNGIRLETREMRFLRLLIDVMLRDRISNKKIKEQLETEASFKNVAETDQEEEKDLVGSLAEKKLPIEGCTGRNGEREESSWQKTISDDKRIKIYGSYEETDKDWRMLGLQWALRGARFAKLRREVSQRRLGLIRLAGFVRGFISKKQDTAVFQNPRNARLPPVICVCRHAIEQVLVFSIRVTFTTVRPLRWLSVETFSLSRRWYGQDSNHGSLSYQSIALWSEQGSEISYKGRSGFFLPLLYLFSVCGLLLVAKDCRIWKIVALFVMNRLTPLRVFHRFTSSSYTASPAAQPSDSCLNFPFPAYRWISPAPTQGHVGYIDP
ncbi:hypothetical protein ANN_20030 [Periplaneta americana]|uniref:Uncharacterized protein n=1 Tax=Periplaneta americana TaxID=6978 RepID=A0ABQ8SBS2_PERAM|nr:hypothetical protein ANN_20030 [Periplaneta americana]